MTRCRPHHEQRGVTLLEVMAALTIGATLMTASMVVLRSNYAVWTLHEAELDRTGAANAVLRRVIRGARQAVGVTSISAATATSGSISLERPDGQVETWSHASGLVTYRLDSGSEQTLSDVVTSMVFEGFEADGVTPTTEPSDIHAIRCTVTTTLPSGDSRSASSYAWVRSW